MRERIILLALTALLGLTASPRPLPAQTVNPPPGPTHTAPPHAPKHPAPTPAANQGATKPPATNQGATKQGATKPAPTKPKPAAKPAATPTAPTPNAQVEAPPPVAAAQTTPPAQEFTKGTVTGFNLPRYAALKSDKVNMRVGPNMRYQIDWLYQRPDLPVLIDREFETWRHVIDSDGVKGWIHSANLTGRRSFVITATTPRTLRRDNTDDATPVAQLNPGVIGHILKCDAGQSWCWLEAGSYRGWLKRTDFWGVFPDEVIQ